jgi:kumamolisin
MMRDMRPLRLVVVLLSIVVAAVAAAAATASAAGDPTASALAQCERQSLRCYDVDQVQHAYGVDRLHSAGVDGRGTTIAIIMSPSSLLAAGLQRQSELYGLPAADLTVVAPAGDPGTLSLANQVEPNLDVQAAHAMAPGAKLLFLAVPGPALLNQVLQAEPLARAVDAAVAAGADVISMSFGGTERRYGPLRAALARAARAGVPAITGSGDTGVVTPGLTGRQTVYPAADANVTAVGGTQLILDRAGRRLAPDVAWGPDAMGGASGGGVSRLTPRPSWQRGLHGLVGTRRTYPDISMIAAASSQFLIFLPGTADAAVPVAGTSIAAPMFAGVVALARQQAGRPLRDVNRALYRLARHRAANGIVDVVVGNNGMSSAKDGRRSARTDVRGYLGGPGYDLVTGLGTIVAPRFVPALARAAR